MTAIYEFIVDYQRYQHFQVEIKKVFFVVISVSSLTLSRTVDTILATLARQTARKRVTAQS